MNRKVAFKTLGCRLNQFETDSLITDFHNAGYSVVDFNLPADVYIINTCTVTNQGDRKSNYTINKAIRTNGSDPVLVVTGCMVSGRHDPLKNRNDITYVVDNKRKGSILSLIDAHYRGEIMDPESLPGNVFNFSVVEKGMHTRSAVKVQDGCDNYCTYCIVPSVRGRAISRPVDDILDNIRSLLELGNKEIVLTGVNISRYNYENIKFDDLVEKIIDLPGDFRVRISSIEPEGFTDKFVSLFENPNLCPHLHLCLQSGSDKVLLQMRRFYTVSQYMSLIEKFRKNYNDFNFTTDVIVCFPGETASEFRETCSVVKEAGFSHIHTFKYSRRTGTRADRLPDQIGEKIKNERSAVIRELSDTMKHNYRRQFINKEQTLLVERNGSKGGARGYGEHYIPVVIQNKKLTPNTFHRIKIVGNLHDKELTALGELAATW